MDVSPAGSANRRHEKEATERWGETSAYKQSTARTKQYGAIEWQTIEAEAAAINQQFADLMNAATAASSNPAMDVAELHRAHISQWFYDCDYPMHVGLGQMYVSDRRFTASFDSTAPGLASYVGEAIAANAARHR